MKINNALLEDKQDKLVSGTNIKTINSTSLLGSGNISTSFYVHYITATTADDTTQLSFCFFNKSGYAINSYQLFVNNLNATGLSIIRVPCSGFIRSNSNSYVVSYLYRNKTNSLCYLVANNISSGSSATFDLQTLVVDNFVDNYWAI